VFRQAREPPCPSAIEPLESKLQYWKMLDESLIADKIFEPEAKRKAQEKIARVALNCPVLDW